MKFQMVVQWKEKDLTFEELVTIEEELETELTDHEIDGHDMGSGQVNIFVLTKKPDKLLEELKEILGEEALKSTKIAYRSLEGDD